MTVLKWLVGIVVIFGGLVALLYATQRSLMYFPEVNRTSPKDAGFASAEEVMLDTADGERLIVWHVPPQDNRPVIVYFHGNGGALQHRLPRFKALVSDGTGLIALSYRGYGGSTGRPTEAGLHQDAQAAYAFANSRYKPDRIVLWGESIGGGVAVPLAVAHPVKALILEAPFTSAVDIAARVYPFVPVRFLMKDQFRSDEIIGAVQAPVLILHGLRDTVVPFSFGERLYRLVRAPKHLARFPAAGHNDLEEYGASKRVRAFLNGELPLEDEKRAE